MLAFAHRGGFRLGGRRNTVAAFRHALASGARALETDGWLAPDGRVVLVHNQPRAWPDTALTLDRLYAEVGTDFELSVDLPGAAAAEAAAAAAAAMGALSRLWVCLRGSAPAEVGELRGRVRVVLSADRLSADRIRWAADVGCAAVNQPARRWRTDTRRIARSAGLLTLGYACNTEPVLWRAHRLQLDGIYSDRLRLVRLATAAWGTPTVPGT